MCIRDRIIMIPKPSKSSYRLISLLPIISKIFEKMHLRSIIEKKNLIPNHQFALQNEHSTIDQVHRITNIFEKTLEEKRTCSTIFLDVARAFDKVWHRGLKYKLEGYLPNHFSMLLKSYFHADISE